MATAAQLEAVARGWEKWSTRPDGLFSYVNGEALVRVPPVERLHQTDRQAGRQTERPHETDRQAGRQAEALHETDRQAGRQTDRQTDRPADRQSVSQRDRQRGR